MQDSQNRPDEQRPERVMSHALVELRRHKWWPLGIKSAVLLDVSPVGFKIEFTGTEKCSPDEQFFMQIPLSPFGIQAPMFITLSVKVKWFDENKMRIGGVFENIDAKSQIFLEKIIEKVKDQASGI